MKQRWQLNRAGLFNFWYYDNEEFHFANGKLLLRGSNGSGKSVTMQSLITVLLDGKKSPDRLDPFGSKARRMEDYLLGESEVLDLDERTGYLYLEYERPGTGQYFTTGLGLRAKRHSPLESWGFVIWDNRRVGRDFLLYKTEGGPGGEAQKIPLTRRELENRLGQGGKAVKGQKDYMELVNKHLYGFEKPESFEELMKLLIQLRSPKLSKDFKPTVIYEILNESLPALSDEELRPLSDTIETMDQIKSQLDQLAAGGSIECSSVCFPGAGGKGIQEDTVEQSGQALSGTEALNELYYHFGILRDDLLNFVTCAGIVAYDTSGEVLPVWRAAYRDHSVLNVPLREVVKIDLARPTAGNKVYMVENPGVFSTLLDRCENGFRPYPPLVCSHGQFKLAALLLLDKLVEGGMVIYYSGDFDPEGLLMADRLLKRHPGKVVPWRYTLDDYRLAMSGKKLPERRLRQLEGVRSPELFAVKDGISRAGAAGYQEGIIDFLWEDVNRL